MSARDANHQIFLAGPESVSYELKFRWLRQEKDLIKRLIKKENQGTGLCLGARLIASNHGAQVYRFVDETGGRPVHRVSEMEGSPATVPDSLYAFQMHSGTFVMQEGGNPLSTQDLLRNEGFRLRPAAGLRFHPEIINRSITDWTKGIKKFQRQKIIRDLGGTLLQAMLCAVVFLAFLGFT